MTALSEGYHPAGMDLRCGDCDKWKLNLKICGEPKSDHYAHILSPVHPACKHIDTKKED